MASNETEQLSIFAAEKPEIMGLAVQELKVKQGGIAAVFSGTCNVGSATELNPEAWAKGMFRHGFALAGGIGQAISWFYEVEQELVEEARRRSAGAIVQSANELTDDWLKGRKIKRLVPVDDVGDGAFTDGVNAPNKADGVVVNLPSADAYRAAAELRDVLAAEKGLMAEVQPVRLSGVDYLSVSGAVSNIEQFGVYDVRYSDFPDDFATVTAQELQDFLQAEHGVAIKVRAVAGATGADWLQVDFPGEILDDLPEFKGFMVVKHRHVDSQKLSPEAQQAIDGFTASYSAAFGEAVGANKELAAAVEMLDVAQVKRKRKTKSTVVNLRGNDQNGAAA